MANILKTEKKVAVVSMLAKARASVPLRESPASKRKRYGRLAVRVGQACKRIMDEKMRGLTCKQIEVDEIWGFIGAKRNNAKRAGAYGDVWTFIALDADTKLIPSFVVGKRDCTIPKCLWTIWPDAFRVVFKSVPTRWRPIPKHVERAFGAEVDYGQVVKTYAVTPLGNARATRRHSV
jgi:hypothetical protein